MPTTVQDHTFVPARSRVRDVRGYLCTQCGKRVRGVMGGRSRLSEDLRAIAYLNRAIRQLRDPQLSLPFPERAGVSPKSMMYLAEIRKFIVRKVNGREIRIDITGCPWCGLVEHLCMACVKKADDAQAEALKNPPV